MAAPGQTHQLRGRSLILHEANAIAVGKRRERSIWSPRIEGGERMSNEQIYANLTELFREFFADDAIILTPETTADDIDGWDSFNHISIIVAVETRFGIKMHGSEIERLTKVGDLVTAIAGKLKSRATV